MVTLTIACHACHVGDFVTSIFLRNVYFTFSLNCFVYFPLIDKHKTKEISMENILFSREFDLLCYIYIYMTDSFIINYPY